jgi:predicted ArsR family transcriptional regulator
MGRPKSNEHELKVRAALNEHGELTTVALAECIGLSPRTIKDLMCLLAHEGIVL